jgi:ribulose 1,5-bisphosphate carboxylase large subunit-like protein
MNRLTKTIQLLFNSIMASSSFAIGVPTTSYVAAAASEKNNKTTLELLLKLQKLMDEFKGKVAEMDEEMLTMKIENKLLKEKITELTRSSTTPSSSRRGFFGYGADEF